MQVLHQLPHQSDKNLLVGIETADDAGVYKISDEVAVISTMDFFPPIVDDPATFGAIAAANAMSDVYAMGGIPRLALNIVGFPKKLGTDVLSEILRGSMDKLKEAGALLVGGHSIEDSEVKYGLSVTGFVHPEKVVTNRHARAGDRLVLTKPLGVGVITSAVKAGKLKPEEAEEAIAGMTMLNRAASEAMQDAGVSACTDVTGYGLIGHAMEMARGSDVSIVMISRDVPVYDQAREFVTRKSCRPRILPENKEFLAPEVRISPAVDEPTELVFYDPQTSGGLLISVAEDRLERLLNGLASRGINGAVIGEVIDRSSEWRILVE